MASTSAASSTCDRSSHWANSSNTLPIMLADSDIHPDPHHGLWMNPRLCTTLLNTGHEDPNCRCRVLWPRARPSHVVDERRRQVSDDGATGNDLFEAGR